MATWYVTRESDGQWFVLFKDKTLCAPAGRCSAATPRRLIVEWLVNEGAPGDVLVLEEGTFVMPLRSPAPHEVAC